MATGKKRLNPETGKPFKRGYVREDGYIFVSHKKTVIDKEGFYQLRWKASTVGLKKRLNPETGKLYKRGDTRSEDDLVFFGYMERSNTREEGYFYERWWSKELHQKAVDRESKYDKEIRKQRLITKPKQINPSTGRLWKMGEYNQEIDRYFQSYATHGDLNGEPHIRWATKKGFYSSKISGALIAARKRAKKRKVSFDLTKDYLLSIFPEDRCCPVLGIEMAFGKMDESPQEYSPSLDRIKPELGYVKGNVVWISMRANVIKADANSEEILKVAKWLKKQESK